MKLRALFFPVLLACLTVPVPTGLLAQSRKAKAASPPAAQAVPDYSALHASLEWRLIGPFRGGRSAAVTGVPGKPDLYYMGSTGGGVWRTTDGGLSWENISDGYFGGSVGAVAVSHSDPNVLYVGGGEVTVRGNVSHGYGVWRSEDAGKSWTAVGLANARHIPRIRIHPGNPDLVYAAVLGDIYRPGSDRGVYRSRDGGRNWERILFANDHAGAVDLVMDPTNPRILYASTWRIRRTPYSLESGGDGSLLWKSTDGGDTWSALSGNPGWPQDTVGIIGVTVSPVRPDRVWAIVESKNGGVFRSDDAGKSWTKVNQDRALRQRAWYYSRIYADLKDPDQVYVVNVSYHRSSDGGRTFQAFNAQHGDHHDLWIAPEDPLRMVMADDGGAGVSYDGGKSWSTYHNQPTAQFYRLTADDHFPFRIYAAQQDNSTIRIAHRTQGGFITDKDWEETAGCECGHIAVDPRDNDIVYGGCYDGLIERKDHRTGFQRAVNVWPDNPMGHGVEDMKYRFQWNFPIFFSPHDPNKLYSASNHLHVTTDGGQSWELASPDLTRNDPSKQGPSGGPITKDNTSVEYYCTIFAAAESPLTPGLIWTGSDDGLVHLTTDGGAQWTDVTPPGLPEWAQVNSIEPSPLDPATCYLAATAYKSGDYRPYLFRTRDFGKSWELIVQGIDPDHFTRVVRADPDRPGLLYAGTESGMYISFDDGAHWTSFQKNLPVVPITDLLVKDKHLVAATQGRSIWIMDDLTVLHQLRPAMFDRPVVLFQPQDAYRTDGSRAGTSLSMGTNHRGGLTTHFFLSDLDSSGSEVSIAFLDASGKVWRSFHSRADEKKDQLQVKQGANTFTWNLRLPDAKSFDGMILWWARLSGPRIVPGDYSVRLTVGTDTLTQPFRLLQDPRSAASPEDLRAQFDHHTAIAEKISEAHEAIATIRDIKKQLTDLQQRLDKEVDKQSEILRFSKQLDSTLSVVERKLYQTQNQSGQDPLNFPIRLTNKLAHLLSLISQDYPPTRQALAVQQELTARIDDWLAVWYDARTTALPDLNRMIREAEVDLIGTKRR